MERYKKSEIYHTVKKGNETTQDWTTTINEILQNIAPKDDETIENHKHQEIYVKSIKIKILNSRSLSKKLRQL